MALTRYVVEAKNVETMVIIRKEVWGNNIRDVKKTLRKQGYKFIRDITYGNFYRGLEK